MNRGDLLERAIASISPLDHDVAAETARLLDAKTKPPRSLGRLEELACRLAAIRGRVPEGPLRPAIVVAAADHGVAARGVSAYPNEVTAQMLANFAIGMIERGIALAEELAADGVQVLGLGEMGIANTTSASALTAALLPADPSLVCGPGTGIDDEGLARKVDAVRRGLAANGLPSRDADPADVLSAVGGLEIAFLVGVTLGAAARRIPVLLDGFVSSVAALVATGFREQAAASLIAATRSPEPGHALVLRRLELEPLLDLALRLGEGTGAALALPLVRSAIAILTDMATFDAAGVDGPAPAVEPRLAAGDA